MSHFGIGGIFSFATPFLFRKMDGTKRILHVVVFLITSSYPIQLFFPFFSVALLIVSFTWTFFLAFISIALMLFFSILTYISFPLLSLIFVSIFLIGYLFCPLTSAQFLIIPFNLFLHSIRYLSQFNEYLH